ncbi:hypothetical protein DEU56DRAFT_137636 [Suillus clintonianus]|uniref:uncharacterized protein n=1 Tax=Suillus clintonianus TaxID=1904413 RepID=UPI001B879394|nr:uncharacterized protein DEU56DRAFT_137636 [Suillus clintonianus]KAG2119207.1 hypothetical protein DEU56DRAFT_137636 [Suillus clintonianus]
MNRPLPRYLYRVYDEESCSQFNRASGFVASIPNAVYNPEHRNARRQLKQHMNWGNRYRTPFISVTGSREKALEYALQRVEMGRRTVSIVKIDSSRLERANIDVYRMCDLVEQIGAYIKPEANNEHEYLCVRRIPANAVIECLTLDDDDDEDSDEY